MKSHKQTDVGTENISPSVRMSSSGKEDLQEVENLIYCQLLEFVIHDETVENMKEQSPKMLTSSQRMNMSISAVNVLSAQQQQTI